MHLNFLRFICICAVSLFTMQSTKSAEVPSSFETRYDKWRKSLQVEIDENKSWIYGDVKLLEDLGKEARQHDVMMLARLRSDAFAVLVLEASNTLQGKFKRDYPKGIEQRRVVWLKVLTPPAPNQKRRK